MNIGAKEQNINGKQTNAHGEAVHGETSIYADTKRAKWFYHHRSHTTPRHVINIFSIPQSNYAIPPVGLGCLKIQKELRALHWTPFIEISRTPW